MKKQIFAGVLFNCFVANNFGMSQPIQESPAEYSNRVWNKYIGERKLVLDEIETLYFALGCKVIASENYVTPIVRAEAEKLQTILLRSGLPLDNEVDNLFKERARKGLSRANQPDECRARWQNRPEMMDLIRRMTGSP